MWLLTFGNSSFKVTFCTDDRSIYKPAVCEDEILVNRPLLFLLPGLEFVFSAGWSSRTLVTDLPAMSPSQGGSPSPIHHCSLSPAPPSEVKYSPSGLDVAPHGPASYSNSLEITRLADSLFGRALFLIHSLLLVFSHGWAPCTFYVL